MIRYIIFFRIFDWIHILGLAILGYAYASKKTFFSASFLLSLFISALYLTHGYSLNETFDNNLDDKVKIREAGFISFRKAILLSYIIFGINMILASVYSWQMLILVIFGGFIGFLYSVPPIRLKQIPFLGLICNSLCFTPLFLIGYSSIKSIDLSAFLMAIFIFFLFLPIDLIHQLNDFKEDKLQNIKTTAVVCGIKNTLILITLSLIILSFWSLFLYRYKKMSHYLFFLTLLFSALIIIYLFKRFIKYGDDMNKYKIKLNMRYLFIAYGISFFVILYFKI